MAARGRLQNHDCRGPASAAERPAVSASRKTHARKARTSGRCRAAAVVRRQPRSGAAVWRATRGTSVLVSSSRAISVRCPTAAPTRGTQLADVVRDCRHDPSGHGPALRLIPKTRAPNHRLPLTLHRSSLRPPIDVFTSDCLPRESAFKTHCVIQCGRRRLNPLFRVRRTMAMGPVLAA